MSKTMELEKYDRKEVFLHYNQNDNPFIYLTIKLDVTEIYNYCKIHKNYYATMGYIINRTVNAVDCFKYRYIDDKIVHYDSLNTNYTQKKDNKIGYFTISYSDNYNEYIESFIKTQEDFYSGVYKNEYKEDEIWVSCAPWFDFTSLVTPFNKKITIPQFIWGKFFYENNRVYTHLMIMVHHGFADGQHIGDFIDKLNNNIKEIFK